MEKGLASAFVIRWPIWPSGPSWNEIERARISMMARSSKAPSIGRIQKRKTNFSKSPFSAATRGGHTDGPQADIECWLRSVRAACFAGNIPCRAKSRIAVLRNCRRSLSARRPLTSRLLARSALAVRRPSRARRSWSRVSYTVLGRRQIEPRSPALGSRRVCLFRLAQQLVPERPRGTVASLSEQQLSDSAGMPRP